VTNLSLAQSYLLKARSRLKVLQILFDEGDFSDVVREAQESSPYSQWMKSRGTDLRGGAQMEPAKISSFRRWSPPARRAGRTKPGAEAAGRCPGRNDDTECGLEGRESSARPARRVVPCRR
jgi:hypothetical protein